MTNSPLFGVYGASGCGRSVMPLAREQIRARGLSWSTRLVFIDDTPSADEINGHRVMTYAAFLAEPASTRSAVIAIADGTVRSRLWRRCAQDGVGTWSVRAGQVVIMDDVLLGEGAILSPFVTIGSNVRIGAHFHANINSYVEHDCRIGDFVTFAPGVHCNGNVHIEDHVYVGSGTMIRQGTSAAPLTIGEGAIIGMGAVVLNNVGPRSTVVGNPARVLPPRQQ